MSVVILGRTLSTSAMFRMLEKAIEWWNKFVALAINLVTQDITLIWNGSLWQMITDIYDVLLPVGYALCVMTFLLGLFKVAADMVEQRKFEHIIKAIIRYILTYAALKNGLTIIKTIVSIVQGCIQYVFNAVGMEGVNYSIPSGVRYTITHCTTAEDIVYFVLNLLVFLLVILYGFMLLLTVVGRFARLGIAAALLPIGFAWFGGDITKDMGRSHLKTYFSTCLEGLVLVVALCLSTVFVNNFGVTFEDNINAEESKRVYSVTYGSKTGTIDVTVINDYKAGGYVGAYYDYPTNKYSSCIVSTNVKEEDMVTISGVKYYPDNIGDHYEFQFANRDVGRFYEYVHEFAEYLTARSNQYSMDSLFEPEIDTLGYTIEWMLVLAFNIILFVNMVKGMDSFANNLIKGG